MRAWEVVQPGPVRSSTPLVSTERPVPEPLTGEIRVRVRVCGICRTDLHLAEGDLPPRRRGVLPGVVPGHEVVGVVDRVGAGVRRFEPGERAGIAWLRETCGSCRFCRSGRENLCLTPKFTGWDSDGGYAEYAVVDERYAYHLPDRYDDEHAAPLLCAGIIGYRALRLAAVPPGGQLGLYGFGASAHITAQIALHGGTSVFVITRSPDARRLALAIGCDWAGDADERPPVPLDSAVLFAPVGTLVPPALAALDRGGTLAIAGIHLTDVPALNYDAHLFQERRLRSVTANTRRDGDELLALADRLPLRIETQRYPFERAMDALRDLAADRITGVGVLRVAE